MTKSMKQKSLARAACAIGLGLAICAGAPTAAFAEYLGFPDVNPTDWYASTVEWATENHVINGSNGYWMPAGVVDRGTAATILYNFSGAKAPAEGATFSDADTFGWAANGIAWAQDMGIFNGYDGDYGAFGAWDTLTREQAATVLYNMFGNGENTGSLALDAFDDSQDVSLWARAGVAWAAHYKIMGQGGTISPHATCTRAEFVTMLMRVSELDLDDDTDKPGGGGSTTTPGDDQKPGDTGGDQTPDDKPGQGDEQKPGSGDDEKPGTGDDQKPEQKPGDDDDEKDPDQGGDQGGTTNPDGGNQGGSTTDPGEGDEKPQEPTGSYNLSDGTWTLKGTVDAENGYYNNVAFYGTPVGYVNDGTPTVEKLTMLYNADLKGDVASVTNTDGVSLKQSVDFDVSRTFNESAGTITTKVTGKNGNTGTLTVTEKLHQASALVCAPMYCNIWGNNVPMRFNDGELHMLYRLIPTVTGSVSNFYYNQVQGGKTAGAIDTSTNTFYYTKPNDSRLNDQTVDNLVCSWFDGSTPESGTVLEPGMDYRYGSYYRVSNTVTDLKTDNCGNPDCKYGGRHDFSVADERNYCGLTGLYAANGNFMANVHKGNDADPVYDIYVLPVNLTD